MNCAPMFDFHKYPYFWCLIDTILSLTNHIIDSLLGAFSVPINSTLTLDWTVKSNILNKFSDTAKSFQITFVRKKLGFNVTSPTNNDVVSLQNNGNKFFNWEDLNHYISVDYQLLFVWDRSTFQHHVH